MNTQKVDELLQRTAELEKELAAKNRELQLEAALDRVRTRTMAMQKSEELPEAAQLLFQQVRALGLPVLSCGYNIFEKEDLACTAWMSDSSGNIHPSFQIPLTESPSFIRFRESKQKAEPFYAEEVSGKALANHYNYMISLPKFGEIIKGFQKAGFSLPTYQVNYVVNFSHGNLIFIIPEPVPVAWDIFKRFAAVFEQTYTRFLDLQKAEAQAREAQIELGLERVRARAMAMQQSDELAEVATLLFQQVSELGIQTWTTGFNIWSEDNNTYEDWITDPAGGFIEPYVIDTTRFSEFRKLSDAKKSGTDFFVLYQEGEILKETYEHLSRSADKNQFGKLLVSGFEFPLSQYVHLVFGAKVSLMFITYKPVPEAHEIFKRFGKVFEQTYIRFLDLQKAEVQAREARIEAALEQIRSRSLAMHQSNELIKVISVMFEKLKELNVLLGTVAIWLFNRETQDSVFWVGNEWQQPAMVHLPFDEQMMKEDTNYKDSWEAWLAGVGYINKEYTKEQKDKYFRYVFAHNDLVTIPPAAREMLMQGQKYIACLHVEKHSALYFDCWYGATYNEERIQVLKRVAKVFEQAYVRFLDLQKAEALALRAEQDVIEIKAARTRAEDALAALKATQQQLIQAEKMASLGELTAGIAHEIQNPLNFVNNFSGVNKELVFELRKEARAGNIEEVMSLADTIEQNETKISHHGQRADAIVKSMLQHSRGASGNRQPTDLNQLIEEHLRLAYHGYRAKDQAFNADIGTEYDPHVGQLNVVPQEIGRVLLNLFSNAFYAVQEKSKQLNGSYEPTVSVSTKREGNKVLITVNDNGTGMSQKVTAKIFQPFFTTKPTGEGTGLGLSLSYDIVTKGHGGNLSVTSREGEGSEFVVELPAS